KDEKAVIGKNDRIVGFLSVRKYHRHPCRFSGDDKRAKVFPKALNFGLGGFLRPRFVLFIRHDCHLLSWPREDWYFRPRSPSHGIYFADILRLIAELRPPPAAAPTRSARFFLCEVRLDNNKIRISG